MAVDKNHNQVVAVLVDKIVDLNNVVKKLSNKILYLFIINTNLLDIFNWNFDKEKFFVILMPLYSEWMEYIDLLFNIMNLIQLMIK